MDHSRRWILAGGLLLAAAAMAAHFWPESPKNEHVASAAPPAVVQPPSPVPQRTSEPDVAKPAKAEKAAPAATPASAAASGTTAQATLEFKPPTLQDFGQIALIGMHGGTPKQAGEAAYVLQTCLEYSLVDLSGAARRLSAQDPKRNARIAAAEWLENQCKSITPEMQAQRGALAERAVEAGLTGVSSIYGRSVGYRPPEALRNRLLDAMKTEFREGDRHMSEELGFHGMKLGMSKTEARAYLLVAFSDAPEEIRQMRKTIFQEGPFRDMSEEEVRESEAIAERLKQERKPPKRRNG
jgi:hypothetical protein